MIEPRPPSGVDVGRHGGSNRRLEPPTTPDESTDDAAATTLPESLEDRLHAILLDRPEGERERLIDELCRSHPEPAAAPRSSDSASSPRRFWEIRKRTLSG